MSDFTVPTRTQSTGNVAGFETISEIIAEQPAPTGGTLQSPIPDSALSLSDFTTVAIPWIFVNYQMPLTATQEILWERTDGDITVILAATPYKDADGVTQQHLPSGRIAREVLMYLVTSAWINRSPVIKISETWRGLLRDIGIEASRNNVRAVQKQLRAILKMAIQVSHQGTMPDGTNFSTSQSYLVGSSEKLFFNRDGLLDDKHQSVVRLSQEFYERIIAAPSPVHGVMHVLLSSWRKIITENPHQALAGDVFLWLTGRMSRVRRDTYIPWDDLMGQFGSSARQITKFRAQFRAALEIAAKEYFAPLGEDFDSTVYVGEYGVGTRGGKSGLLLSPISAEHQKLLSWSNRRAAATSEAPAHYTPVAREVQVPVARQQKTTVVDVVPIAVHAGVDLAQLRAHLTYNGLDLSTVSDGALRAAIDAVFSLTESISNPQALAAHSITKKPSLLGITAPASTQKATTPSAAPIGKCPVHTMDITGKVCSGCAAELKATSTTAAEAQICWDSIKSHLNYLADTYGVDTSAEKEKYSGFAAARGASVKD
jgi:hypothetical protein